jgi:hypothetical protein
MKTYFRESFLFGISLILISIPSCKKGSDDPPVDEKFIVTEFAPVDVPGPTR